ncbi:ATP-binding protein [Paenibacillus andongensis]|uniref:ATP-binding protein n=1 Tax=Paenibacillus andongensis TaxID=2975482 RepID=UPI0021BAB553|nr:ATP-binding protein [Paenibacillus andongensis]
MQHVVRQSLSLEGAKASMKQIRMSELIDEKLWVIVDKEMLDLILRNLLSNANKFTGIVGMIEIGAFLEGDRIIVSVSDNGVGIDEKTAGNSTERPTSGRIRTYTISSSKALRAVRPPQTRT